MRKSSILLILFLILSTSIFAQSNSIEKLFEDYSDNDDFTSVYISANMFSSFGNKDSKSEINDVLASLKGLQVLTTNKNPMDFFKIAKSKLNSNDYEELMRVNEGGAKVLFYVKNSNGTIAEELVLLVGESDETVLMSFIVPKSTSFSL